MSYALMIWMVGQGVIVESYLTMMDCRVREATIQQQHPGASTSCIWMEEKKRV
jgi:hypothetical protein